MPTGARRARGADAHWSVPVRPAAGNGPRARCGRRGGPGSSSGVLMVRFFLAVVLPLSLPLLILAADWPQFLGPNRDGHSTETGLNWDWPQGGPPVVWKQSVGSGWAGPVVAGDRLILF